MFTQHQRATLRALVDRVIPPDDFPGGWQAGVGNYLERQLAGDLRGQLDSYRGGLDALDAEAQAAAGAPFAALDAAAQDQLLSLIESGTVATPWPVAAESSSGVFFAARFSRSFCFFNSYGVTASILFSATISILSAKCPS